MENDPEVIRKEMQQTRNSLSEKLEALSDSVTGTVNDARHKMMETVDTFRATVTDTVSSVKGQVTDTVDSVKQQFTGTVDSVKDQFTDSMDSVKETFDVEHHVVNHPLAMVGGAVALGYLGGMVLNRISAPSARARALPVPAESRSEAPRGNGLYAAPEPAYQSAAPGGGAILPTFLKGFEPELQQLKSVAIGAVFGMVRDLVQQKLPPNLTQQVSKVVDDLTTKMGGKPVEGHLLDPG